MAQTDFQTHLSALLNCGAQEDLPAAAARFILGSLAPPPVGGRGRRYLFVDALLEEARRRFSVELKHVDARQSSHLGRLYTRPGGFVLKIRTDVRPATYRFVKAHELAHLLAYDREWQEPRRSFPNSPLEERLCDSIARHLLLPAELLEAMLDGLVSPPAGLDVGGLESLSKEFLVIPWQVLRRAIERDRGSADVTAAILWKLESDDTLRIADRLSPSGLYIPLKDRCFRDGGKNRTPWKALEGDKAVYDEDDIQFGSLSGKLLSAAFPTSSPWPSVIQVVYLDSCHLEKVSNWRAAHGLAAL